jgi:DNA (cytosine-5)-methyltransferase 1
VLDLFSGIGGFSLGLERARMQTIAFCEIEPYCQAVLRKHWPSVPIFGDITKLKAEDIGSADVICGGFPCQDISSAGKGAGIEGARSGLWKEFARLIREIRPKYAIIENVPALRSRGLARVLSDLCAIRYDAEWHCIPASAVGARHRRDRIWIVAYPNDYGEQQSPISGEEISPWLGERSSPLAESISARLPLSQRETLWRSRGRETRRAIAECDWWTVEPALGRMAHGVPRRVDRLRALGNAVVPQIAEIIGRAIMEYDQERQHDKSRNAGMAR